MDHLLICKNARCRFVLDARVNGKLQADSHLVLKSCPACGSQWSSACPFCGAALTMKLMDGLPSSSCCSRRLRADAKAA